MLNYSKSEGDAKRPPQRKGGRLDGTVEKRRTTTEDRVIRRRDGK